MATPKDEQIPMSLENLPGHLKFMKEQGSMEDCLVDMGRIVMPAKQKSNSFMKWTQRIVLSMASVMALAGIGVITYELTSTQQLTVVVDVTKESDARSLAKIVSDDGGKILAVKQTEEFTYEVKVSTRKSRPAFLEWMNKNKHVKKAVLKE